ncbi:5,6-dimethylbenzimidazole synthase [Marmoricola sp. URHB0036]|uniref:5,6-dimethylbenzimidazole synthase n=1 Tax=Marmoricola sp. URHB0036 TaxID=1298863 RepID=UPI0004084D23|nr:5,6-dimethylbenzimidazole synthase [Marmoricola sp. URHB0036]
MNAPPSTLSADLYDVIARRRDVRAEFSSDPLDPDVLERVLQAAHSAPSVGHSQPWDFVLVRDTATRERFQEHVATERASYAASLPEERQQTFGRIKVEGVLESALAVVVTYDPDRGGTQVLGRHAIDDAGLYSAVLAIQNLWLAATAEGLGVGWVSFYREEFLRDLLAIPERVRPIAWLCVGPVTHLEEVPDLERHGWRQKRPLAEAIHHEKYGSH